MNGQRVFNRAPRDKGRSAADTAPEGHASSGAAISSGASDLHISDHAVLRYLERAYGLDVVQVRTEMSRGLQAAVDFGAAVVICHGVRLILVDGCRVVTALPKRRR